jgi:hypothetical protein
VNGSIQISMAPALAKPASRSRFVAVMLICCLFSLIAQAAETNGPDSLPQLIPPKSEIPPSYWEQHGPLIIAAVAGFVVVAVLLVWFLLRPKPVVPVPPEVTARNGLARFEQQSESGAVLSAISHIVRNYFAAAFSLPAQEMTTSDFSRLVNENTQIGPELAKAAADFLNWCDQRKFSPGPLPNAERSGLAQALDLIARGEARRAELTAPNSLAPVQKT